MGKRKIFTELMEGVAAMQAQREGKVNLRSCSDRKKQRRLSAKE